MRMTNKILQNWNFGKNCIIGFQEKHGQLLGINVEYIFKNNSINRGIKEFCKIYEHESIHRAIRTANPSIRKNKNFIYGEERAVFKLTGEKWTKRCEEFYRRFYNAKAKKK